MWGRGYQKREGRERMIFGVDYLPGANTTNTQFLVEYWDTYSILMLHCRNKLKYSLVGVPVLESKWVELLANYFNYIICESFSSVTVSGFVDDLENPPELSEENLAIRERFNLDIADNSQVVAHCISLTLCR
jgi:hypothetical protein